MSVDATHVASRHSCTVNAPIVVPKFEPLSSTTFDARDWFTSVKHASYENKPTHSAQSRCNTTHT